MPTAKNKTLTKGLQTLPDKTGKIKNCTQGKSYPCGKACLGMGSDILSRCLKGLKASEVQKASKLAKSLSKGKANTSVNTTSINKKNGSASKTNATRKPQNDFERELDKYGIPYDNTLKDKFILKLKDGTLTDGQSIIKEPKLIDAQQLLYYMSTAKKRGLEFTFEKAKKLEPSDFVGDIAKMPDGVKAEVASRVLDTILSGMEGIAPKSVYTSQGFKKTTFKGILSSEDLPEKESRSIGEISDILKSKHTILAAQDYKDIAESYLNKEPLKWKINKDPQKEELVKQFNSLSRAGQAYALKNILKDWEDRERKRKYKEADEIQSMTPFDEYNNAYLTGVQTVIKKGMMDLVKDEPDHEEELLRTILGIPKNK